MINKISPQKAKEIMDTVSQIYIADVREEAEYAQAHIRNAKHIPLACIYSVAPRLMKDKRFPVLVYCRSGARSARAAMLLKAMGYENIFDFGGILSWPYEIE